MQYMTSLAPPALTATAISIMATILWVIGKSVRTKTLHFVTFYIKRMQVEFHCICHITHCNIPLLSRLAPYCQGC